MSSKTKSSRKKSLGAPTTPRSSPKSVRTSTTPRSGGKVSSALKQHREMEQHELQTLNKRLENVLMRQRAQDEIDEELKNEIEKLRAFYERELESQSVAHEEAVLIIRSKRDQFAEENKLLKANNKRQEALIAGLRKKNEDVEGDFGGMQQEIEELRKHVDQLMTKLQRVQGDFRTLEQELDKVTQERDVSVQEAENMQGQLLQFESESQPSAALESQMNSLQEDLEMKARELKQERLKSRRDRDRASTALEEQVRDIREQLKLQMTEMMDAREQEYNARMQELRENMEEEYMEQLNDKSDELQHALDALAEQAQGKAEAEAKLHMMENDPDRQIYEDQTERIHGLQREMAAKEKKFRLSTKQNDQKYQRELDGLLAERDAMQQRIQQLETQLTTLEDTAGEMQGLADDVEFWKDEATKLKDQMLLHKDFRKTIAEQEGLLRGQESLVDTLRDQLDHANADLARKDEEYESLLGLKVALDMEIKSYRSLLEVEENRLGIGYTNVPSKKRKRGPGANKKSSGESSAVSGRTKQKKSSSRRASTPSGTRSSSVDMPLSDRSKSALMSLAGEITISNLQFEKEKPVYVEVSNESSNEVTLDGWTLKFETEEDGDIIETEYSLPDVSPMRSGESIKVWLNSKPKGDPDRNIAWDDFEFNEQANYSKFCLVNPYGSLQSNAEVFQKT